RYFLDVTTPCNKREPGAGCSAIDGHNRDAAVLGASEQCVATHPSDMAVALAALDAVIQVHGPDGTRAIPLTELYRLPGNEPARDTMLRHGELITAVELPDLPIAARSTYRKVRDRASYAFALVSVAAAVDIADDVIRDTRIALGGLAHQPWRATRAEELLRGAPATQDVFRAAADAELAPARPLAHNAFKVPMAANTLVAVLRDRDVPATHRRGRQGHRHRALCLRAARHRSVVPARGAGRHRPRSRHRNRHGHSRSPARRGRRAHSLQRPAARLRSRQGTVGVAVQRGRLPRPVRRGRDRGDLGDRSPRRRAGEGQLPGAVARQ